MVYLYCYFFFYNPLERYILKETNKINKRSLEVFFSFLGLVSLLFSLSLALLLILSSFSFHFQFCFSFFLFRLFSFAFVASLFLVCSFFVIFSAFCVFISVFIFITFIDPFCLRGAHFCFKTCLKPIGVSFILFLLHRIYIYFHIFSSLPPFSLFILFYSSVRFKTKHSQ